MSMGHWWNNTERRKISHRLVPDSKRDFWWEAGD